MTDPSARTVDVVADLVARMTLEEKAAQLYGVWVGADADGDGVAPHQTEMVDARLTELIRDGLGQLTRPFGTAPVDPATAPFAGPLPGQIVEASRFGIPALAHEECLAGFTAWAGHRVPGPAVLGRQLRPGAGRRRWRTASARTMRSVGVHQGLAPVLDVTRDPRWGRTEETIGEDPYLVGTVGTAYVRGLESAGVVATLKHFAGYSGLARRPEPGARPIGRRELADVILPPVRDGAARGRRALGDALLRRARRRARRRRTPTLLTDAAAGRRGASPARSSPTTSASASWRPLHGVAGTEAEAAALALAAGRRRRAAHRALLRRAAGRCGRRAGRWTRSWSTGPCAGSCAEVRARPARPRLGHRPGRGRRRASTRRARPGPRAAAGRGGDRPADQPGGVLPLAAGARVAVVGPLADDPLAMLGCYSVPRATSACTTPSHGLGIEIPTVLAALRARATDVSSRPGLRRHGSRTARVSTRPSPTARTADVCVVAVGDRAGLFGRGTSGEGCDATDLQLPGVQAELVRALLATGTPVVLRAAHGPAVRARSAGRRRRRHGAGVLPRAAGRPGAGRGAVRDAVNPSGRLPVSMPRGRLGPAVHVPVGTAGPALGRLVRGPDAAFPFGHGLSYTPFSLVGPHHQPRCGRPTATTDRRGHR